MPGGCDLFRPAALTPKLYNTRDGLLLTRLPPETKLLFRASLRLHRRCEHIINANGYPNSGDDVALFIDWENFKISLAAGSRNPNVSALKEEVSNHGRVVVAKAYADWVTRSPELRGASQFIIDPPALYAAGIEPVYVPTRLPLGTPSAMNTRTTRVKNSVDVKMTADCIECAHTYPNIGTYVLVSGDSDFIHVINSLRAIGKRVIIIGVSYSTSRRLADQVDGLILYDIDVDPEHQPEPETVPAVPDRSSRANGGNRQQLSDVMRQIEEIVRSERNAGRTPLLTSLKQRIMRRVPGFDEKKLGFSGFKKLMLRTAEEGTIKLATVGLVDWVIMADEPDPVEAVPDSRSERSSVETVAADEEVILEDRAPADSPAGIEATAATENSDADGEVPPGEPAEGVEIETPPGALVAAAETLTESDSVSGEFPTNAEASSDAPESDTLESDGTEGASAPALSPGLVRVLDETLAQLELPRGPGDGQDGQRITDLVIMADMLEHQEGITHVAFNFLLAEVCGALQQGLDAEHPEITGRWGGRTYSRTYVTRLLRELGDKEIFLRDWHQERNEETGRTSRFRTFNLNRTHPLVREALVSHWGPDTDVVGHDVVDHEPAAAPGDTPEALPEVEMVDEQEVIANGASPEVAAEEGEPAPVPARRPSRRRGRQAQPAEAAAQSADEAVSQTVAEESSGGESVAEESVAEAAETGDVVAEEATEATPARTPRRRGRQRPVAEETSSTAYQAGSEPGAIEDQTEGATPARPSLRQGRQRQAAEETSSTEDQAAAGADTLESPTGEDAPAPGARPFRRRGRQRQVSEVNQDTPPEEPGPEAVAEVEDSVPDAEPAPAAVD